MKYIAIFAHITINCDSDMGRHIITKDMAKNPAAQKTISSAAKSSFVKVSSDSLQQFKIKAYSVVVK